MPPKVVVAEPVVVKKLPQEVKTAEKTKINKKPEVLESNKVVTHSSLTVPMSSKYNPILKPKPKTSASLEIQKPIQATFSAYKQLNNLRSSINEKIMADELSKLQQFRSPSVMHGEQIPVPNSTIQLTPEQEREKRITRMSDDISITKYDNGMCTIERKQMLGSPVEGSSSMFACGESKFDQNFRAHMQKVRDKIIPAKTK